MHSSDAGQQVQCHEFCCWCASFHGPSFVGSIFSTKPSLSSTATVCKIRCCYCGDATLWIADWPPICNHEVCTLDTLHEEAQHVGYISECVMQMHSAAVHLWSRHFTKLCISVSLENWTWYPIYEENPQCCTAAGHCLYWWLQRHTSTRVPPYASSHTCTE